MKMCLTVMLRSRPNLVARLGPGYRRIAASRSSDSATALFPAGNDSAHRRRRATSSPRARFAACSTNSAPIGSSTESSCPAAIRFRRSALPGVEAVDPALHCIEIATQAVDVKLRPPTADPLGGHRFAAPLARIVRAVEQLASDRL